MIVACYECSKNDFFSQRTICLFFFSLSSFLLEIILVTLLFLISGLSNKSYRINVLSYYQSWLLCFSLTLSLSLRFSLSIALSLSPPVILLKKTLRISALLMRRTFIVGMIKLPTFFSFFSRYTYIILTTNSLLSSWLAVLRMTSQSSSLIYTWIIYIVCHDVYVSSKREKIPVLSFVFP